jgi:hypothetical protein
MTRSKATLQGAAGGVIAQKWSTPEVYMGETFEPEQWRITNRTWRDGLKRSNPSSTWDQKVVVKFPCPVGSDCLDCGPRSEISSPLPPPAPPPVAYIPLLGAKMSSNRTIQSLSQYLARCQGQVLSECSVGRQLLSDIEATNCIDGDLSTGCMSGVFDYYRVDWERGSAEWDQTFLPPVGSEFMCQRPSYVNETCPKCRQVWPGASRNGSHLNGCGSRYNPVQDGDSNNWITVRVPEGSRIDDVIVHNINNASYAAMLPDWKAFTPEAEVSGLGLGQSLEYFQSRLSPFQVCG